MIRTLFRNEWRAVLRDGRGIMLLVVGALLALVSTWTSASTDARQELAEHAATDAARSAWNERHADAAHSRAHYGDYVFRPGGSLAKLDSGLEAVTGRVIYTEAHRQNDSVHKPQQASGSLLRYDRLEPSTVLQLLVPLIMVLAGFGVISAERESGRLRLLWIQGVRPLPMLVAKTMALWTLGAALCVLVVGAHMLFAGAADVGRTMAFLALHLAALWIVAALIAGVSAWARRPGTAAAILLCFWVLGAIVLPRLAALTAEVVDPLPDRDAFQAAMQEDREQGLDGHDPRDVRRLELERQVLAEYGVRTRQELPVRLGGLIMQADEEYGAKVWDKHFGDLERQFERQYAIAGVFSFLNPLQATDRLSMALAGTGLASHLEFLRQTEGYRRELMRKLNEEDAHGVRRDAQGRLLRTTTKDFYTSFSAFEYQRLTIGELLGRRVTDVLALAAWLLGAIAFMFLAARHLDRRGIL
ncbi:MAG: DUF3526 domain-containing protein [Planctomycetota bacterium]|jgi:ABC-2 type transport system permease protein